MARIISMIIFKQSCAILRIKPDMPLSAAPSRPDGSYPGVVMALHLCTHVSMSGCCMSAILRHLENLLYCVVCVMSYYVLFLSLFLR